MVKEISKYISKCVHIQKGMKTIDFIIIPFSIFHFSFKPADIQTKTVMPVIMDDLVRIVGQNHIIIYMSSIS